MQRHEFKNYLKSYCSDMGLTLPDYDERTKLYQEFSKIKYSDQMDLECELWDFFDKNVLVKTNEKKNMKPISSLCTIQNTFATMMVTEDCSPCKTRKTPWPACKQEEKQEEKEDTMTYNETEATRKYLTRRATDISYSLRNALEKQFNLDKRDTPATYKDMIDAIKNGLYTLDKKRTALIDAQVEEDGRYYGSFLDGIKWNLPNKPDYDGYTVAEKAMLKVLTNTLDVINTTDAATALKAVQDFEGWTYTAPTTTAVQ